MKIGGFFRVIQYHQVIQLLAIGMAKNGADNKPRAAALQVFKENALGLGKGKPVRHLKNMGGCKVFFQQHIQIHIPGEDTKGIVRRETRDLSFL